jgi:hypothetical protein
MLRHGFRPYRTKTVRGFKGVELQPSYARAKYGDG